MAPDTAIDRGTPGSVECNCCGIIVYASVDEGCFGGLCDPYCLTPRDTGTETDTGRGGEAVDGDAADVDAGVADAKDGG